MVDRWRPGPPFGESSYFFGSNIPGKPRKYLLNSGGRPKLFAVIATVRENDYADLHAFRVRRAPTTRAPDSARPTMLRQTVATGVSGEPTIRAAAAGAP